MLRRAVSLFAWCASAGLLLAIVVRLTVRDRFMLTRPIFYGAPWPVIAAAFAILAVWWFRHGRRRLGAAHAVLAVVAFGTWLALSWRWQSPPAEPADLRVVLWNVSRPESNLLPMARWLRAQDADVIALAEGHRNGTTNVARWQQELPGYSAMEFDAEMTILVRGKILREEPHPYYTELKYHLLHVEVRGRPLTILQIDINGSVRRSRERAIGELTKFAHDFRGENLVVLGDFNTPRESLLFDPLRAEFTSAFEAAGRGSAETWPVPLPVLAIDQIWCSPSLLPVFCRLSSSFRTDHRAMVADFRLAPGGEKKEK